MGRGRGRHAAEHRRTQAQAAGGTVFANAAKHIHSVNKAEREHQDITQVLASAYVQNSGTITDDYARS